MDPAASEPLALPAPESSITKSLQKLHIDQTIKLDDHGPMVVNSDGTLSRIANWKDLTKQEQERTIRVLGARNKLRMANESKKQLELDEDDKTGTTR